MGLSRRSFLRGLATAPVAAAVAPVMVPMASSPALPPLEPVAPPEPRPWTQAPLPPARATHLSATTGFSVLSMSTTEVNPIILAG